MTDDRKVKAAIEEINGKLDIAQMLKDLLYDGYDNYEDYVKYGDSFVKIAPPPKDTALLPPVKK